MPAVDADMVLVAEGWDREIDTGCTIFARLGLGVFDRKRSADPTLRGLMAIG
jgi:hypothetical protein